MILYPNIEEKTAFGAGDKQIGFCRNGNNFKPQRMPESSCEAFLRLYIRGGGIGNAISSGRNNLTAKVSEFGWINTVLLRPERESELQGDYTSTEHKTWKSSVLKTTVFTISRQIPALVIKINALLAQLAEAIGLSPIKSRFESEGEYHKISGLKRFHPDCLNRVYEKIEYQKYKQGLRRANREKAKHLISGNLEREGDNLTASVTGFPVTADHNVVAHMLKSIAEKNCLYFTCYIRVLLKGLVMGQSPSTPSRDS